MTTRTTMTASDGSLFEHVTCGCPQGAVTVNVPHFLVTECVTSGATPAECALRLANRPRGGEAALVTTAAHMASQGLLAALPGTWAQP